MEDGTAILLNTFVDNVIDVFVVRRQQEVGLAELIDRVIRSRGAAAHTSPGLVRDLVQDLVLEIHSDPGMPFMVDGNQFVLAVQDKPGIDGQQLTALMRDYAQHRRTLSRRRPTGKQNGNSKGSESAAILNDLFNGYTEDLVRQRVPGNAAKQPPQNGIVLLPRFALLVKRHLVANFWQTGARPLALGIFGRSGDGKSAQLAAALRLFNVEASRINASEMESELAGKPGQHILRTYKAASMAIADGVPAALVIEDIDVTVGEWEQYTGTVNHQHIVGQLMHLADQPVDPGGGYPARVPVFVTGNNLSRLYKPLRRPGRMHAVTWRPEKAEILAVVDEVIGGLATAPARARLAEKMSDQELAFFGDVRRVIIDTALDPHLDHLPTDMGELLRNPGRAPVLQLPCLDEASLMHVAEQVLADLKTNRRDHLA